MFFIWSIVLLWECSLLEVVRNNIGRVTTFYIASWNIKGWQNGKSNNNTIQISNWTWHFGCCAGWIWIFVLDVGTFYHILDMHAKVLPTKMDTLNAQQSDAIRRKGDTQHQPECTYRTSDTMKISEKHGNMNFRWDEMGKNFDGIMFKRFYWHESALLMTLYFPCFMCFMCSRFTFNLFEKPGVPVALYVFLFIWMRNEALLTSVTTAKRCDIQMKIAMESDGYFCLVWSACVHVLCTICLLFSWLFYVR